MLRRYWCFGFASVALLNPYPINHHAHAQTSAANSQNRANENSNPADLTVVENNLDAIASAIESSQNDPESQAKEDRAQDDLDAQKEMAKWAFWMFIVAALTTVLTGAGILLIWRTLIPTSRASRYAGVAARMARKTTVASQDMAAESQKATRAMLDSNGIARDSSERQLRAYISLVSGNFVQPLEFGRVPEALVFFVNAGSTPAYNVKLGGQMVIRPRDHKIVIGPPDDDLPAFELGPNQQHMLALRLDEQANSADDYIQQALSVDEFEMIESGRSNIYFMARADYVDAFGKSHTFKLLLRNSGLGHLEPTQDYPEE